MDEKIDKIISLCGTKNKYQIILLIISFLSQVIFMSVPLSLPYLEDTPFVTYIDPSDPTKNITENLSYKLCKNNISYSIVEDIHYSIIMDTNCYCNRFKTALFGGLVYFGAFLGSFFYDVAADNFGRKITFIFSSIFYAIFNSLCAFSTDYWFISSFIFIQSLFCCLPNYASLMITTEVSHVDYRGIFSTIIICGFPASALMFFPIYKFLDSWKITFLINSASSLLLLLVFCLISYESPRYYFSKGQIKKGIDILRKISEFHGINKEFDLLIEKEEYQNIINELNVTFGNKVINKENENDEEETFENIKKIENTDNRLFDGDLSDKDIYNLSKNESEKKDTENMVQKNDNEEDNNNINLNIKENAKKKENEIIEETNEKESDDDENERDSNDNIKENNISENEIKEKENDDEKDRVSNENINEDDKDKKENDEEKKDKENEDEKQQEKIITKEKEIIQDLNNNNSENIFTNLNNDKLLKKEDEIIQIKETENKISNNETETEDLNNLTLNKHNNANWKYLFKFPSIRYKFLILCFFGFTVNGTYTGISITTKNLPGDMFINTMIISVCEITFGVIASFLINTKKLGRKGTLILLYSIAMTSFIIFLIFKKLSQIAFLIIFCISRFSCFGLLTVVYTYFLENYPTCIRALAFGINSSFDNFGGTVFPFIIENISQNNLYILLATLNFLEILCMLYMPETYGKPLPETIEELDSDKLFQNINIKDNNKKNVKKKLIYFEDKLKEPIIPASDSNRSSNYIY